MMKYPLNASFVIPLGIGLLAASCPSVALAEPTSAPPASTITVKPVAPAPEWGSPAARATAPEPPAGQWYGWQTLLGMAGAHAVFFTGLGVDGGEGAWLMAAGGIGQLLIPPVVHFANGYGFKGLASIGLTIGIPAAVGGSFFLAGVAACDGRGGFCGVGWAAMGAIFGGIAYLVTLSIDLSVVARHPVKLSPQQNASSLQVTLAPIPSRDGAAIGLRGQF